MPDSHNSLDQGGQPSPTNAEEVVDPQNQGEADMAMFVDNFARAIETGKNHE